MIISDKVLKYGDDINTDGIIPGKYLVLTDYKELGKYAMEGVDPKFTTKVKDFKIIVAGKNFGCGSSREQAPIALKESGLKCVVAKSFARIFYRNAINIGLPVMECINILDNVDIGDELSINFKTGVIINQSKNENYDTNPVPDFILDIMKEGLVEYVKRNKK